MKASERRRIRRRIEMEGGKCPKCRARGAVQLRGEQVMCVVCGAILAPEQENDR